MKGRNEWKEESASNECFLSRIHSTIESKVIDAHLLPTFSTSTRDNGISSLPSAHLVFPLYHNQFIEILQLLRNLYYQIQETALTTE